jgi:SAM-dependent methyltransferase
MTLRKLIKKTGKKINSGINSWYGVKPLRDSQSSIEQWFQSLLGQRILLSEQSCLNKIMPKMYGYHLMQLSVLNDIKLSEQSPVTHHFSLGVSTSSKQPAIANFEQLPINAESIDTAILHHVLEYSTNPHQLLRETARTIIPNGYIIIVGFNPYSTLGLKKYAGRTFSSAIQWRYHALNSSRLVDWLRVLDFEPVDIQHGYHGLPFNRGYRQGFDHFSGRILPSTGAFYVITARKSVIPMTIIKKPWKNTRTIPGWVKGSAVPREPALHRDFSIRQNKESAD